MADLGMIIKVQTEGLKEAEVDMEKLKKSAADLEKTAKSMGFFWDRQGRLRDSSTGRFAKVTDEAAQSLRKMKAELDGASKGVDTFGNSVSHSTRRLGLLEKAIMGAVTIHAVRKLFDLGDSFREMSERVRMATDSVGEFEYAQARLAASANESFRPLAEAQELFIATNDNLRGLGYSLSESLDITDSLSFAFVRNATAADKARTAIDTYDRVLSKGKMNAQEWQSISSGIGTLTKSIGDAFGKTAQEIDRLGHSGKLSAEWLTEGLLKSLEDNRDAANSMVNGRRDAMVMLGNEFESLWGRIDEGAGITARVASGIIFIADNLEYALPPALIVASIATGKLTAGVWATSTSLLKLIPTSSKATAATLGLSAAANTATKSISASAMATKAWTSSLAFLGGPVGASLTALSLAATGFMMFSSSSRDATTEAEALGHEVEGLARKIERMNKAKLESERDNYSFKLKGYLDQKKSLEEDIARQERENEYRRAQIAKRASLGSRDWIVERELSKGIEELGRLEDAYIAVQKSIKLSSDAVDTFDEKIKKMDGATVGLGNSFSVLQRVLDMSFVGPIKASAAYQTELDKILAKREDILASSVEEVLTLKHKRGELEGIIVTDLKGLALQEEENARLKEGIANQATLSGLLSGIEEQYKNIGLTTSQIALNRALELDIGLKEFALLKQMLDAIDNAPKLTGKTSLNYFDDALKSINNELISTKALTQDLTLFGDPSQYTAFSEMTMQLNDTKGVLANITASQRELLLYKAQELDSQKQINAILELGRDTTQDLDDLEFEISLYGKSQKEIERLTFFRNLDNEARLISIGMTAENISLLQKEIEAYKQRHISIQMNKEAQERNIGMGIEAGFQQYIDNIGTMRDSFADATQSVFSNIEGFLVDFATTGKASFSDMTTSILRDISRIVIQMAMMEAVTGMQGWMKGLGWFSGGGSVPISPGIPYQAWTGGPIPEYATGGRVIDFSSGGFTGIGGKFEPKGIVHGGEYVMSKAAVNNLGVGYFEQLHDLAKRGRGFANGGHVGRSSTQVAMGGYMPRNQTTTSQGKTSSSPITVNVHNNAPVNVETQQGYDGNGMPILDIIITEVSNALKNDITKGGAFSRTMEATWGLRKQAR